jgi:hypothetical protein
MMLTPDNCGNAQVAAFKMAEARLFTAHNVFLESIPQPEC